MLSNHDESLWHGRTEQGKLLGPAVPIDDPAARANKGGRLMETAFRTQATVPRWVDGYAAGLAITIPFMPTLAAIVSVVAYVLLPDGNVPNAARTGAGPTGAAPTDALVAGAAQMSRVTMDAAPGSPGDAVAIGLIVAAMAWLVLGLVARPLTSAESVQPRVFGELRMRLRLLRDRLPAESDLPAGA
ncbi:MAG TPA: hypothetical protein VF178_16955, partial [Gemmatimonadaceae bacterium]